MTDYTDGYEHCYCLFLDILGFKSKICETIDQSTSKVKHPISFPRLLDALQEIQRFTAYPQQVVIAGNEVDGEITRPTKRKVTQFSDSVVISYPRHDMGDGGLLSIIFDVQRLHLKMASYGILLRGSITEGLLFHSDNFVFGPAMNEAVELEKEAKFPRVVIAEKLIIQLESRQGIRDCADQIPDRTTKSMIVKDVDGRYYVDYFNLHPEHQFEGYEVNENWVAIATQYLGFKKMVGSFLLLKDDKLKEKQDWMRAKFNQMADAFEQTARKSFCGWEIPENYLHLFNGLTPISAGVQK